MLTDAAMAIAAPDADPAPARIRVAAGCSGVVKIYWTATGEVHALKGIDGIFPAGAVTAVVGPSGSGKSSLLRILAAMEPPTAGQVTIGDTELSGLSPGKLRKLRRRLVGYVFQRPSDNLVAHLNVVEHLQFAARLKGVRRPRIDELLDNLGIAHRRHHRPPQLSGGEQQRVAFAQAVVGDPVLVVADEPTAELDSVSGEALLETVVGLAHAGTAVVLSTHDPAAVAVADATLYLRHGAVESETRQSRSLSVIDATGRLQLPPSALGLFPDRRAVLVVEDGQVRLTPP